jgi:hypothetical protein
MRGPKSPDIDGGYILLHLRVTRHAINAALKDKLAWLGKSFDQTRCAFIRICMVAQAHCENGESIPGRMSSLVRRIAHTRSKTSSRHRLALFHVLSRPCGTEVSTLPIETIVLRCNDLESRPGKIDIPTPVAADYNPRRCAAYINIIMIPQDH